MDVIEVLDQVRELLQRQGRLSYRLLKKQFALDEEGLEDLKYELVDIQELAVDKDGKMLVLCPGRPFDKLGCTDGANGHARLNRD